VLSRRIAVALAVIALIIAACQGGGGSAGEDMLARVKRDGVLRVATDANYAPQSFLKEDGTSEGFDVDVATEVAKRLGVKAEFQYPQWSVIEGGNWADRFDVSVGSMTVTKPRLDIFDFTQPYYFTPAQMSVLNDSGITTLEGLAGKVICTGEATTYWQWLQGTLVLGDGSALAPVPDGATATTLATDQDCAQSAQSGRRDFDGWQARRRRSRPPSTRGRRSSRSEARSITSHSPSPSTKPPRRMPSWPRRSTRSSARCMPTGRCRRSPTSGSAVST
jgi:ABC-type amino acid transport substrate-binding protein